MRDIRDPELIGLALLSGDGSVPMSVRYDTLSSAAFPDYGTKEADGARLSFNGKLPKQPRRPVPEPTHALDAPPDLVDDRPVIYAVGDEVRPDLSIAEGAPCPSCGEPRAVHGRWRFCLNQQCDRYEEAV